MSPEDIARRRPLTAAWALLAVVLAFAAASSSQDQPQQETPAAMDESAAQEGLPAPEQGDVVQEAPGRAEGERRAPGWALRTRLGNKATIEFPTNERNEPRVQIEHVQTGIAWHLRLTLGPFAIEGDAPHAVRFRARSDGPRTANVGLSMARPPFRGLSQALEFDLTPLWKTYQSRLVASADEETAALQFNLGGSPYAVEFTDVELVRLSDRKVVVAGPKGPPRQRADPEASESTEETPTG